jgi:hypothetical protein
VKVGEISNVVEFFVFERLSSDILLGFCFWELFDIAPEFVKQIKYGPVENFISELGKIENRLSLSKEQLRELELIEKEFEDVSFEKRGLGCTNLVEHKIITTGDPIRQRYYPLSPAKQEIVEKELDMMLQMGVVVPSRSSWSNPILIVDKKDGTARFCLDSRKLNAVTKRENYPIPNLNRTLANLRNAKYISSVDLSKAFWQIPLEESSCEKTAFVVPRRGLFHFVRLPFGLVNASSEMQCLSDRLFGPQFDNDVFCYVDDLILISSDFDSHIKLLKKVKSRLQEAGLTVKLSKCEFF